VSPSLEVFDPRSPLPSQGGWGRRKLPPQGNVARLSAGGAIHRKRQTSPGTDVLGTGASGAAECMHFELGSTCAFRARWRVGIERSRRAARASTLQVSCRSRSATSGPMKRTLRRNRGRERGRGPSELMLLARGSVGERSGVVRRNEWRQSHELLWDPAKGTGLRKALRIATAAALHGDVVRAVSAALKKSVRAKALSVDPGRRQKRQRFGRTAHGGEETRPPYDAERHAEARSGVVKRSALRSHRAKVR
jgi:hypothetical protein